MIEVRAARQVQYSSLVSVMLSKTKVFFLRAEKLRFIEHEKLGALLNGVKNLALRFET
jgi:hypothetical protein